MTEFRTQRVPEAQRHDDDEDDDDLLFTGREIPLICTRKCIWGPSKRYDQSYDQFNTRSNDLVHNIISKQSPLPHNS